MERLKSGNMYVPKLSQIGQLIDNAKKLGLNALNVPVLIDFTDTTDSSPKVNQESKGVASAIIARANTEGLKTILEPYPFIANGTQAETELMPSSVPQFFTSWKAVLDELIRDIATPYNVYAVYTASNFVHLEAHASDWMDVFVHVKSQFTGLVSYRTNWWVTATWDVGPGSTTQAYLDKLNNPLFGSPYLDFISIAAYFELDDQPVPSVPKLVSDFEGVPIYSRQQNVFKEVKAFYDTWHKPIFFGELGCASREYAAMQPWSMEPSQTVSEAVQANLFEAYGRKFGPYDWFMGFSIWQISDDTSPYYPVGKQAEQVIMSVFGDLFPDPDPEVVPDDRILIHLPAYYKDIEDFMELANTESIELNLLDEAVDQLFNDQFVETSGLQAIKRREQMLGIQADPKTESLEFRRRRILNRYQTKPPFTRRYLQRQLDMLVGPGMTVVTVDYAGRVLTITASIDNASVFKEVLRTVETIKPANMSYQQNTSLEGVIELEEHIGMKAMTWNYKLDGSWKLGEKPFVSYGSEVSIK